MILYVISVGLSVTMGLMGFINLAHGVFAMAGAMSSPPRSARFGCLSRSRSSSRCFRSAGQRGSGTPALLCGLRRGELAQVLFTIGLTSSPQRWRA